MASSPVRVLFITGFGRSGSTILDSILGQVEGFFSAGELHYLWDRGLRDDRFCGCGETFSHCSVWPRVVRQAFPSGPPDVERMVAVREAQTPKRAVLRSLGWSRERPHESEYAQRLGRLYAAIAAISGASVIVDSSKSPGHGAVLQAVPGIELRVIHLVRDSRAVAWSWQKRKVYDASGEEPMYMTQHSPWRSGRYWLVWNLVAELIFRRREQCYRRLRYETFMSQPRQATADLVSWVGRSGAEIPFESDRAVKLGPTHAVAGNPSRFQRGAVDLRVDDEWKQQLPASQRWLVTLLTWPLLWRYGYLG